jgi:glycosyltransferase involved in cell wall biosynthesis
MEPKISVVIPCKNHASELKECLSGLRRMKIQTAVEIIVVDSASSPEVLSVSNEYPEIKLIRSDKELDAASARNEGVRKASGDYLSFIDADCIPTATWLDAAWRALRLGAQMAGGPVSDMRAFQPIASADNILQFADLGPGRPEGFVEMLPACNLAVRREAFDGAGGFPKARYIEDVLFTSKVAALWPGRCRFIPEMGVLHKGRNNFKGFWEHHYIFGYQRGFYGFRITKRQQNYGRFPMMAPLVAMKRLIYIYNRIFLWNRRQLFYYIKLLPFIIYGLTGWALGFQRGCAAFVSGRNLEY